MTAQLLPCPIFKGWDANANPLANGQLFTYQSGTSTPQVSYTDATQGQQQTNPVILNARGEASVWLDPTLVYKLLLQDSQGNFIWSQDQIVGGYVPVSQLASYVTQTYIGSTLWPRTAAEIAANVTPTNFAYPQGDPRRYGAAGDGVTDDTAALQKWANVGGALTLPALTFLISAAVNFPSYATVVGTTGAIIFAQTINISLFACNSVTGVSFKNIHFKQGPPFGSQGYNLGAVFFNASNMCSVEGCIFENTQWSGVTMLAASNCTARGNYFTGFTSGLLDQAGVWIGSSPTTGSAYCVAEGNFCFGGGTTGVTIQDPYNFIQCNRNVVANNMIGAHTSYGVLVYLPTGGDSYNKIIGNHIEGVLGGGNGNASSGNGIYLSNGVGGCIVANNVIRNCCINTGDTVQAPAAIGSTGGQSGGVPLTITGNVIEGMTKYWGILLTGCGSGASVVGNSIRQPSANTTGDGIKVANSQNVTVEGNNIIQLSPQTANLSGILVFAQGAPCGYITIANNTINGGHHSFIRFTQSGGNQTTGATVTGNIGVTADNNAIGLFLDTSSLTDATVSGNYFSVGTNTVITQATCTNVRYSNNRLRGTGTVALTTSGANTGSFFDLSNTGTGAGAGVSNGGTALQVEVLGTAVPGAGTWAVGDMVRNSSPSAAGVLFWVCTTAGSPGTFKTVSNT